MWSCCTLVNRLLQFTCGMFDDIFIHFDTVPACDRQIYSDSNNALSCENNDRDGLGTTCVDGDDKIGMAWGGEPCMGGGDKRGWGGVAISSRGQSLSDTGDICYL